MIKRTKHAGTNYKMLLPFLLATDDNGGHKHFKSAGYMDLIIENLCYTDHAGNAVYSISHYGEQNGYLMADPDMTIAVDKKNRAIIPRTYQNDYMGLYHQVFKMIGGRLMYSQRLLTDLDAFLWQWLQNIESQGFVAV